MRALMWMATAIALLTLVGCRDFVDVSGARFADRHLMAGRPLERGGPSLRDHELRAGEVRLYDGDLVPLRNMLRTSLRLSATLMLDAGEDNLPGTVDLFGLGTAVIPNANFEPGPAVPVDFTTPFGRITSTQGLLDEIDVLCSSPLIPRENLGTLCDAFEFDLGFSPNPIDGVTLEPDFASVDLSWVSAGRFNPRPTSFHDTFPSWPLALYPLCANVA